ncbi:MAG: hypothetical protein HY283_02240 [Nitrospirae bacterium]|nr:hypothetical protein [Nitrospirota bacterium]
MRGRHLNILGGVFIMFGLLAWGCANNNNDHPAAGPAVGFVVTTDFSVGNLSTFTTTTPRTATTNILGSTGIYSDSVIRAFGNRVFIIQRLGSNSILVIDPNNPGTPLANYTANDPGPNTQQSNPKDMAFVSSSKAYISRYELNTVLIVNPLTGERLGTVDLTPFADSDGIVEMGRMVIVNGKLYVALQRVDRNNGFTASNDSYVIVIDVTTDQVVDVDPNTPGVQPIVLKGRNPTDLVYLPSTDRIYLADTGTYITSDAFGGIEAVNPNTNATEGIIISDDTLGGAIGVFGVLSNTIGYATVFDQNFNNFVVPFNLSTQQAGTPLTGIGSGYIPGLAFDKNGFLYVADRDATHPGIQVFDTNTNVKVEGPIDTGLPPFEMVFVNL